MFCLYIPAYFCKPSICCTGWILSAFFTTKQLFYYNRCLEKATPIPFCDTSANPGINFIVYVASRNGVLLHFMFIWCKICARFRVLRSHAGGSDSVSDNIIVYKVILSQRVRYKWGSIGYLLSDLVNVFKISIRHMLTDYLIRNLKILALAPKRDSFSPLPFKTIFSLYWRQKLVWMNILISEPWKSVQVFWGQCSLNRMTYFKKRITKCMMRDSIG